MKVLLALLLVVGFGVYLYPFYIHSEIQPDSQYPTNYLIGGIYRTNVALMGAKIRRFPFVTQKIVLVRDQYEASVHGGPFGHKPLKIPPGTHLRVERLVLTREYEAVRRVLVEGRFLDGPFAGSEITLEHISRKEFNRGLVAPLLMIDSGILELVSPQ